jgi:hypothetical protein
VQQQQQRQPFHQKQQQHGRTGIKKKFFLMKSITQPQRTDHNENCFGQPKKPFAAFD